MQSIFAGVQLNFRMHSQYKYLDRERVDHHPLYELLKQLYLEKKEGVWKFVYPPKEKDGDPEFVYTIGITHEHSSLIFSMNKNGLTGISVDESFPIKIPFPRHIAPKGLCVEALRNLNTKRAQTILSFLQDTYTTS